MQDSLFSGYPPYTKDEVFKEILEQADNFKKHSPSTVCRGEKPFL